VDSGNADLSCMESRKIIRESLSEHMRKDTHLASDGLCMLGRKKDVRQDLQGRDGIFSRRNGNKKAE
jgi:hypothetical protein